MWKNYLKVAWRTLVNQPFYSGINIIGLVLGMCSGLLIGLWALQETTYDRFLPEGERIYKVNTNYLFNGELKTGTMTPVPLAGVLKEEMSQIEHSVVYADWGQRLLLKDEGEFIRSKGYFASEDFFEVFGLEPVAGDPAKALANPGEMVISSKVAGQLFGGADPLGESLTVEVNDELKSYTVGAVYENSPHNSTIQADWVIDFREIQRPWMGWGNTSFHTWVKTVPQVPVDELENASKGVYAKHTDFKDNYPVFQPLYEVHLYNVFENGKTVGGRVTLVRNLSLIGFLILVISCVNFVSLVTARASVRGKEVGVRKVFGAGRKILFGQFIAESLLVAALSMVLTLVLVKLILPLVNDYLGIELLLQWNTWELWGLVAGIGLVAAVLSCLYPSFVLSGLSVSSSLKQELKQGMSGAYVRRGIIICQFFVAVLFISGILVIYKQQDFIFSKDLGLQRENVLYVPLGGDLYTNMETVRQEVLSSSSIISATVATHLPVNIQASSGDLSWPGKDPQLQTNVSATWVGYDFVETMGIKMAAGREFSPQHASDRAAYLVNEAAVDMMGMEEDPIGQQISFWNGEGPIVGVMENFHLQSLHSQITPLILVLEPENASYLLVRTRAGQMEGAIADLEETANKISPQYPLEYHFLDQEYGELYRSERMVSHLILSFGIIAIAISCLGLLGLVAFTTSRRIKEIGIRKVLGASAPEIALLLSRHYLWMMLIGWLLAAPVSWIILDKWLSGFAYKIGLEWWYFVCAGLLTVGIALLTVSSQAIKAALLNPAKTLKNE